VPAVRRALTLLFVLLAGCTCKKAAPAATPTTTAHLRKFDVHTHFGPNTAGRMLKLMNHEGIDEVVNLSGGWPGEGLEQNLAVARQVPGRIVVFANPPTHRAQEGGDWGQQLANELRTAKAEGAVGVKFFKSLGLGARGPDGKLIPVDDPALDPLFETAGELGMPVAIHTGDPKAFWLPPTPDNERYDELSVHPRWSYSGKDVPSWQTLFDEFEHLVAKHPKTTFIGVHFGNDPEDPARVAQLLEKYPNLYVDTAARVPELGRYDAKKMRDIFLRFQDRILFGTDLQLGGRGQLVLGSSGALPPTPEDVKLFFGSTWRYFETNDTNFASPTPIQGRWTINGIGLPREVLEKVYAKNADRLLGTNGAVEKP